MATYTTNGGIKKIATGDESGTWGTSTNTNFDIIDRLAVGVGDITLSGTTHTLTTNDGATSDGQYHVLVLGGSPSGTNTITVSPSDAKRLYIVKNSSGQSAIFSQGSGSNVTVANGASAIIYCDGAGASAAVVDLSSTLTGLLPLTGGTMSGNLNLNDSVKAQFGTGTDLQIYHDGSNSYINDQGTGSLKIVTSTLSVRNAADSLTQLSATDGGAVRAYYAGSEKLTTTSGGVTVTGTVTADGVSLGDSEYANFGVGNDLQIFHDGSNSYIQSTTGNFNLTTSGGADFSITAANNGAVTLFYDNSAKIATTSTGVDITGNVVADGCVVDGTLDIEEVFENVSTNTSTSGTLSLAVTSSGVFYLTANQSANRTINFTSVNSTLGIGKSVTASILLTNGATPYYLNSYQVDGSSVTPKWSGGTAPSEGNASSIDVYTFTIIKTADATFTVLASQTQFA